MTFINSIKDGMYENVYYAAQSHYAGDIVAVGYYDESSRRYMTGDDASLILEAAGVSGINPIHTVIRTIGFESVVYYNGSAVELKYLEGCDWEKEAHLFDKMDFAGGAFTFPGEDGIIISAPSAEQLGARMGDRVTVGITTKWGQKNTGSFLVKGIVRDSSIFGYYKAYISRVSLNRLLLYGDEDCSTVGFFLDDPGKAEIKRKELHDILSLNMQTASVIHSREEMENEADYSWTGTKIFLLTLPVYLSEISDLLDAMNILANFLFGMMLLLILVSAVITYRLILHERTKEMGIMRTIGFYGRDLRLVLWTEIITLGIISLALGFVLAWLMTRAVSLVSFSWFPGFEIFLRNGRLRALFLLKTMAIDIVSIFILLLAASVFPAFRASRKDLPALLSGEPL